MDEKTLGKTLHDELIAKEGRARLTYAVAQQLKAVTTIEELRLLCTAETSAAFAEDATPAEMVDAWLTPHDTQSDAGVLLDPANGEGCAIVVAMVPLMFLGFAAGSALRLCGCDLQKFFASHRTAIRISSFVVLITGIALSQLLHSEWPMGIMAASAVGSGIQFGFRERTGWDCFLGILIFAAAALGCAYVVIEQKASLWWICGAAVALGTGYGTMRSLTDLFENRPKRVIRHERQ